MRSLIALSFVLAAPAAAQSAPRAAIEAALTASAAGWNAGDSARFMAIYADDAIYASGTKVARGKAEIAAHYATQFAFGADAKTRGTLSFQPVAIRPLSAVHVLYVARWNLAGTKPQSGTTTLLFERRNAGWRIISDHSS